MTTDLLIKPIVYKEAFEYAEEDEAQCIAELEKIFVGMARIVAEKESHAHRAVHAKGQGLLKGTLTIKDDLPPQLAQGIFAASASYDTIMRFSSPPAEQLPDSVSTPRAVAIKVKGVPGEKVPESLGDDSQDFLMVNGPAFIRPGPKAFVKDSKLLAMTTEKMPRTKKVISAVLRGTEAVIEAVGGESATLKGMGGEPMLHPLGETYFTQVPFLFGTYMAKFSLVPISAELLAFENQSIDANDDAQRDSMNDFFGLNQNASAQWELRVQLCTDLEKMPIEDASVEWPQDISPYIAVATLTVPTQVAWDDAISSQIEDQIAFAPWNAVAEHRPLGAINRARKIVMSAAREFRSSFNGCPVHKHDQRTK